MATFHLNPAFNLLLIGPDITDILGRDVGDRLIAELEILLNRHGVLDAEPDDGESNDETGGDNAPLCSSLVF